MRNRRFLPSVAVLPSRIAPSDITAISSAVIGGLSTPPVQTTDPTGTGLYVPGCGGGSSTSGNNGLTVITSSNSTH